MILIPLLTLLAHYHLSTNTVLKRICKLLNFLCWFASWIYQSLCFKCSQQSQRTRPVPMWKWSSLYKLIHSFLPAQRRNLAITQSPTSDRIVRVLVYLMNQKRQNLVTFSSWMKLLSPLLCRLQINWVFFSMKNSYWYLN